MQELTAEELVRWCQRTLPDDTRAFEYLVERYKSRVYGTAYRLMGNRQEAEDQAQEVFVKIFRNIRTLQEPATLPAWITRITVNTCMDALARQRRRPQTTSLMPEGADGEPQDELRYADTQALAPEDAALRAEMRRCIERAIGRLDRDARAALVLRDVNDHSYQEVAEMLKVGLSAVKMRIHRARIAFQQALAVVCPDIARPLAGERRGGKPAATP